MMELIVVWVGWIAGVACTQIVEVLIPKPGMGQMLVKAKAMSITLVD